MDISVTVSPSSHLLPKGFGLAPISIADLFDRDQRRGCCGKVNK